MAAPNAPIIMRGAIPSVDVSPVISAVTEGERVDETQKLYAEVRRLREALAGKDAAYNVMRQTLHEASQELERVHTEIHRLESALAARDRQLEDAERQADPVVVGAALPRVKTATHTRCYLCDQPFDYREKAVAMPQDGGKKPARLFHEQCLGWFTTAVAPRRRPFGNLEPWERACVHAWIGTGAAMVWMVLCHWIGWM